MFHEQNGPIVTQVTPRMVDLDDIMHNQQFQKVAKKGKMMPTKLEKLYEFLMGKAAKREKSLGPSE